MQRKIGKIIIFSIIIAATAGLCFVLLVKKTSNIQNETANPPAQTQQEDVNSATNNSQSEKPKSAEEEKTAPQIPEKFILQIPFYSQAPLSKWDTFHEEMCEEASILNAGLYLEGKKLTKDQFEAELQKIQKIEKDEVGEWKSTTVSQTKKWSDAYFAGKLQTKISDNPTVNDIETEVAAGHPVVVPLAGRDIGNPNFTPPGPIYHMLVIKGYDKQNFITNDVGTRKGDSYTYKKEVLMQNMHDWNEKDIHLGDKRILIFLKS
jgi:hypothetical protein